MKAAQLFLAFVSLFSLLTAILGISTNEGKTAWLVYDKVNESYEVTENKPPVWLANANYTYTKAVNETGWYKLDLATSAGPGGVHNDSLQAYAAGFLEGYVTRDMMKMHWANTGAWVCPEPYTKQCKEIKEFLEEQLSWMLSNIKTQATNEPIWYQTKLFLEQAAGLQDGYAGTHWRINTDIDVFGVYLWQVGGDMETILNLFPGSSEQEKSWRGGHLSHPDPWAIGTGHCSALLRLLPDYSDLYVSQDTWSDFSSMLRMLKKYNFDFTKDIKDPSSRLPGRTSTFSSYPGVLMSGDDFYLMSSGLLSQETTIGYANGNLTKFIKPTAIPEGIRSVVANRLASSGREWADIFSITNSGTYNNEWMIVDYKLFTPGNKSPVPGLFTLLEQIPGTIIYKDLTEHLYSAKYFGSYNTPFFPEIFNKSGQPALVAKFGDWFTYDKTPRALIFKRDVPKVKDIDSMIKLMRYNNFKNDPLSRCNCTPPYSAENAIAARDDLNPADGKYPFGALGQRPHTATDMKVTSYTMFQDLSFRAQSSPPFDDLPPFRWSTSPYKHNSHVGHPDLWQFPAIYFNGTNPVFPGK